MFLHLEVLLVASLHKYFYPRTMCFS